MRHRILFSTREGDRLQNIARTGGRSEWVSGAKHRTARLDGIETLPDHGDDGARSHILDQTREERLILQILVVCTIFFSKKGNGEFAIA